MFFNFYSSGFAIHRTYRRKMSRKQRILSKIRFSPDGSPVDTEDPRSENNINLPFEEPISFSESLYLHSINTGHLLKEVYTGVRVRNRRGNTKKRYTFEYQCLYDYCP